MTILFYFLDDGIGNFTCELDEYAKLVQELKSTGIIKDHSSLLKSQKKTFKGKEAVDWLSNTKELRKLANLLRFSYYSVILGFKL